MGEEEKKKKMVPLSCISLHVNRHLSALTADCRSWLPHGWSVKLVIRADHYKKYVSFAKDSTLTKLTLFRGVDKYYYEPVTNQMFRSRIEIERYLNGEECTPPLKSPMLGYHPWLATGSFRKEKMLMPGGRLLSIDGNEFNQRKLEVTAPKTGAPTSPFVLPQGWVVEKVPRKEQGWDKYYYEPGTGRKFRSLIEVERYLENVF